MAGIGLASALVWFSTTGCAGHREGRGSNADVDRAARLGVERRLGEIFAASESKDFDRLDGYHLYGPKFSKFSGAAAGRQEAEAARQGEHESLGAARDMVMRAEGLRIDVFRETAVATFMLDYGYKSGEAREQRKARGTLVFVKDRGEWKIVHEHFSPLPPAPPKP